MSKQHQRMALLLVWVALAFLAIGVALGDPGRVFANATTLCFSCIGLE
ncbi:MAG: thioredoxin [Chloroflexi bacterium]|nr:thioredoxin [Chloroflexota bacterium]